MVGISGTGEHSFEEYNKLALDLEKQELDSPGGIASPHVYGQLLAIYLLQNDLPNAKFLWKRIPENVKQANPEIGNVWAVGQKLWNRDFPGVYLCLEQEWPEHLVSIMNVIQVVSSYGWSVDSSSKMILPKRPDSPKEQPTSSEEQLAKLTDFVSFLEN
ncbi:COP9 signalosome subunit 8 isoform X2 [Tachypleus tridentatus]|uniref:COP9 signalosome subunit 8 isoform X2 n=1 Tax=Tachypleus tridentatus TaxID=6853 RepID=UPI003FD13711